MRAVEARKNMFGGVKQRTMDSAKEGKEEEIPAKRMHRRKTGVNI